MATPSEILALSGCFLCLDGWTLTTIALQRTADWVASVAPAEDVSAGGLAAQSGCFACLTPGNLFAIKVRLLVDIAVAQEVLSGPSPDDVLAASGCWACLSDFELRVAEVASLPNASGDTIQETISKAGRLFALPPITVAAIEVVMLTKILTALDGEADVTPGGIAGRAGCYNCLDEHTLKTIASHLSSLIT